VWTCHGGYRRAHLWSATRTTSSAGASMWLTEDFPLNIDLDILGSRVRTVWRHID
jgi:hypothetical protein